MNLSRLWSLEAKIISAEKAWIIMDPLFLRSRYLFHIYSFHISIVAIPAVSVWRQGEISVCPVVLTHQCLSLEYPAFQSDRWQLSNQTPAGRQVNHLSLPIHIPLSQSRGAPRHTHASWWRFPLEQARQPCRVESQENRMNRKQRGSERERSLRNRSEKNAEFKLGEAARPDWIRFQKHPRSTGLPQDC